MGVDALVRPEIAQGADGARLGPAHRAARLVPEPEPAAALPGSQLAEVDLIVEAADGRIAGIEKKAGADVGARDVRHLVRLRDRPGPRFTAGVILHSGPTTLSLGDRIWALPISAIWDVWQIR